MMSLIRRIIFFGLNRHWQYLKQCSLIGFLTNAQLRPSPGLWVQFWTSALLYFIKKANNCSASYWVIRSIHRIDLRAAEATTWPTYITCQLVFSEHFRSAVATRNYILNCQSKLYLATLCPHPLRRPSTQNAKPSGSESTLKKLELINRSG